MDDDVVNAEPDNRSDNTSARRRRGRARSAVWDLLVPAAALLAVALAVISIELYRARETPGGLRLSSDNFSPLNFLKSADAKPKLGQRPPDFTLQDAAGHIVSLDSLRGQLVVLNFWATWCIPCQKEAPDFVDFQNRWEGRAQIVGVNYAESAAAVVEFAARWGLNYRLPLDTTGQVTGSYQLTGLPETFFIDRDGILRDHRIGQLKADMLDCIAANLAAGNHDPEVCR